MSEKSYITNYDPIKSFVNLNLVNLNTHETIWKNVIDSHPFNQAVRKEESYSKTILLISYFF